MPRVGESTAILMPAREKLSRVGDSVDAVLRHTTGPFHLYLVDVGYSSRVMEAIAARARAGAPITILDGEDAPLLANAALNRALRASHEPYVCVVENDVEAHPGYWEHLYAALNSGNFDLVSPSIWDGHTSELHFDPPVSRISPVADGGYASELVRRPKPHKGFDRVTGKRGISHLEKHCFAGTRAAMMSLYPFDESVTTRTDIDLSLAAAHMRLRVGMVPSAEVTFWGPPVTTEDQKFFSYRWDLERAKAANEHLETKWKLRANKDYLDFVHEMREFIV
jgi:hypothetical protein